MRRVVHSVQRRANVMEYSRLGAVAAVAAAAAMQGKYTK